MAVGDNIGALGGLGSLTQDEFSDLSKGLQSTNNPIGSIMGYDVTPQTALTTALGYVAPPLSVPMTVGNMIGSYNVNQLANQAMNKPTDVLSGFSGKSLTDLRSEIDANNDKNITDTEVQNYGMSKGLTAYTVGLNPMQGYKPNTITKTNITNVDPTGLGVTNSAVGSTGDLGGGKGVGYSGSTGGFLGFGKSPGVNESGPTGLGNTEQTGAQTSIKNTKDLSKSFADDAASASGDDGTYICTALYEMGDMKKYIYKYDQVYGKRVDPNIYRGYCLWGKYVATKMRDKGIVYKIAKPLALAWAKQMAFDLSKGRYGKKSKVVKVVSRIGESICYGLGFVANLKIKKGVKYG